LDKIDLPPDDAQRLMELGFLPGAEVTAAQGSPLGHTRVFRVDGSEIALRRETAAHLVLRTAPPAEMTATGATSAETTSAETKPAETKREDTT